MVRTRSNLGWQINIWGHEACNIEIVWSCRPVTCRLVGLRPANSKSPKMPTRCGCHLGFDIVIYIVIYIMLLCEELALTHWAVCCIFICVMPAMPDRPQKQNDNIPWGMKRSNILGHWQDKMEDNSWCEYPCVSAVASAWPWEPVLLGCCDEPGGGL